MEYSNDPKSTQTPINKDNNTFTRKRVVIFTLTTFIKLQHCQQDKFMCFIYQCDSMENTQGHLYSILNKTFNLTLRKQ